MYDTVQLHDLSYFSFWEWTYRFILHYRRDLSTEHNKRENSKEQSLKH